MFARIKHNSGIISLGMVGFLFAIDSYAQDAKLIIKPARCIALHEGQVCYQKLKISWSATGNDNYCLYLQKNATPIMCWDNLSEGSGNYEFESSSTQKFILARKGEAHIIAEYSVEVAWVYDASSRRESHWRVF